LNDVGTYMITVQISDSLNATSKSFTLTITNDAPIEAITLENYRVILTLTKLIDLSNHFTDPDGDPIFLTGTYEFNG